MMSREELHKNIAKIFPHKKDFLVKIFKDKLDVKKMKEYYENSKDEKFILVRFSDKDVLDFIKKTGIPKKVFYNAFLDFLRYEYRTIDKINEVIEKWRKSSILPYV